MTEKSYNKEIRKRTVRTAPQVGNRHGEGFNDGAQRNSRIAAMVADRRAESKAAKEKKIADRTAAAEKRKKETLAMATEENLDEIRLLRPTKQFNRVEINAALKKHNEDMKKLRAEISAAKKDKAKHMKKYAGQVAEEDIGTEARVKIKNVARPGDPSPTSDKSTLTKQGEIKVKKVDEEIADSISRKYRLSDSLINAARAIVENKSQVDMEPETDDVVNDDDDDTQSESKTHTKPKTSKEKKLAALAEPKDKITHKDVLVGRGVVRKEEVEQIDELKKSTLASYINKASDDATKHSYLAGKTADVDKASKASQRIRGIVTATRKLTATKKRVKEEVEQVDEVLSKKAPAGEWIKDFTKSDNPKFAGKSPEKRKQMALGAYYAKQNEEVEEIDEKITASDYEKEYEKRYYTPATGVRGEKKQKVAAAKHLARRGMGSSTHRGYGTTPDPQNRMRIHDPYTIGAGPKGKLPEDVEFSVEELAHIESVLGQLDEQKPTMTSAPVRGANQDQSGFGVKKDTANYTISDSKKMKTCEETELEEGRGRPKKSGEAPEGDDTAKHPVQQLHKIALSIQGSEPHFEHKDGTKTKISKQLAKHITAAYGSMRTTQEKDDFANKLHASRDSMMAAVNKHVS